MRITEMMNFNNPNPTSTQPSFSDIMDAAWTGDYLGALPSGEQHQAYGLVAHSLSLWRCLTVGKNKRRKESERIIGDA